MHRVPKLLATILADQYVLVKDAIAQLGPDANNKIIAGLAEESTIAGTDFLPFRHTVGNALKKISWANLLVVLTAYFGSIYTPLTGAKITGVDAGTFGQESIVDDYLYKCVQAGAAETSPGAGDGTAIWKKIILFQSI
jgi:hypothetical protein